MDVGQDTYSSASSDDQGSVNSVIHVSEHTDGVVDGAAAELQTQARSPGNGQTIVLPTKVPRTGRHVDDDDSSSDDDDDEERRRRAQEEMDRDSDSSTTSEETQM